MQVGNFLGSKGKQPERMGRLDVLIVDEVSSIPALLLPFFSVQLVSCSLEGGVQGWHATLIGPACTACPACPVQVSMMSAEFLQYAVEIITAARASYFRDELQRLGPDLPAEARERLQRLLARPLCGLQLVLVGDFLQLPPVDKGEIQNQREAELAVRNMEEKIIK